MSDPDPTDTPDGSTRPPASTADSLRTRALPSHPETRIETDPTDGRPDASIPTRFPIDSYATATPTRPRTPATRPLVRRDPRLRAARDARRGRDGRGLQGPAGRG